MNNVQIIKPEHKLLDITYNAMKESYNIKIINKMPNDRVQAYIIPKIYARYMELNNDISILEKIIIDRKDILTDDEIKAIKTALNALLSKRKTFTPMAQNKRIEGIQKAKAVGKYKGRQPLNIDESIFNEEYTKYIHREITKGELAKNLNISRPTLDKIIAIHTKRGEK